MRRVRWQGVEQQKLPLARRLESFDEVRVGLTLEEAIAEADRCLRCPAPACQEGCPNNNPIRDFLTHLAEGRPDLALQLDWEQNPLPSCTGRVCAWERQCEGACVMGVRGDPIRIGAVERFLGDWGLQHLDEIDLGVRAEPTGHRVAVIGAGPAGLAAAHFLVRLGHSVEVFDAWHHVGGVMDYGIPDFVLPRAVLTAEARRLQRMGVTFRMGVRVGRDMTIDQLLDEGDFHAVFIGTGANRARRLAIPGIDLEGVWTAKEFLMQTARALRGEGPYPRTGGRVAVIGAGNTAMDAARTALRLGASDVTVFYRRGRGESPSREIEMEEAEAEGVRFRFLVNPVRLSGNRRVEKMTVQAMRLGKPDASGRARPEPVPGSEEAVPVDTVVLAIGYDPEQDLVETTAGLRTGPGGTLRVDPRTGQTDREGVFAAGDCVSGPMTVVHAIAGARRAAAAIDAYLQDMAAKKRAPVAVATA